MAETIEHMVITGDEIAEISTCLARGELPTTERVTTARVKPKGSIRGENARSEFAAFVDRFVTRVSNRHRPTRRDVRWEHPWFGKLTAHGWIALAGEHQALHGRQVRAILAGLEKWGQVSFK